MRTFLSLLLLLIACTLTAQRSAYYIRNFPPKEYHGFNQIWQAAQDTSGLMYFAGTTKVFVYDGTTFESVDVKSGSANRQLLIDPKDETVYVGAVGDFGYLKRDSINGKLRFISLSNTLNAKQKEFSDIWMMARVGRRIYFQSNERIFICENKKIVDVVEAPKDKGFALMFEASGHIYVRQRNVGLMELQNNKLAMTTGGERFASVRILGIMPWKKNENLILTGDSGFFLMKTSGFTDNMYSRSVSDTFLVNSGVLGCVWVNDSTFAVHTRTGVGFYSHDMRLIEVIDKSSGILDQSIATVFVDHQKNLWLMHNYGFSKVCYNSPMLYFGDDRGYTGTLECMTRYKGRLFLATTEGLFIQDTGWSDLKLHFSRSGVVPRTEVWDLNAINDVLYISTSDGLYTLYGSRIERINRVVTNRMIPSAGSEIIAMEKGGMTVFREDGKGHLSQIQHYDMPGIDLIYASFAEITREGKYELWCSDRFKRATHLQFSLLDTSYAITFYDTSNRLPLEQIYPLNIDGQIYFLFSDSAYRYDPSMDKGPGSDCFVPAPGVFAKLLKGDLTGLRGNYDSRNCLYSPDGSLSVIGNAENNGYLFYRFPAAYFTREAVVQYILPEASGIIWMLGDEAVSRYNTHENIFSDIPYHATIRTVTIGNDSIIYSGNDLTIVKQDPIPYSLNSITFFFSALFYDYDQPLHYFYMLEGYDTTWYESKSLREKNYTNLHEGVYTFHVKAINALGRYSSESTFTFSVSPPWYRTTIAYLGYAVIFVIMFVVGIRATASRLRKQKERLEKIVKERTAEVVRQKQEIEIQKTKLESAYTDIQDSIHYAERIQNAILPIQQDIAAHLAESFIYFRPRNIVSGDFYWYHHDNDISYLACVDCTGHGVPGAFMSLIGNTLLNQIIIERKTKDPGKILDLLHEGVRHALKQDTGGETRDGMDICLAVLEHQKGKLHYAGANRALWYIRKGNFNEIKGDKFPIAGDVMEHERRFSSHTIILEKGDAIYMSTDGYADQFGGEKGKKFMVKQFQKLLLGIAGDEMKLQRPIIEKAFIRWMGEHEQVDDVLVIGFKYS